MSVNPDNKKRPKTTVILAMTADGKIADRAKTAARFASNADKAHLESQIALVDGVIFGAGTLRAYGSSLPITNPNLLQQRQEFIKPLQPVHILVSASENLDDKERFFQQKIPRWRITCEGRSKELVSELSQDPRVNSRDLGGVNSLFERVIIGKFLPETNSFDWREILPQLQQLGIESLAVLGGGELVASLLAFDLIDELWLTVCPIIFGGRNSPTPVGGIGFLQSQGRKLQLLEVKQIDQEIFLHYKFLKDN
ncbi:pyrimidine reductase, riboflavin biosynthesis [Xenococcus sp. PCC 7305]|uniref:RibD family protein n=1 Tax=Xenococcus sp. PCC 7305 TaxID=102125 RepID=UPI0002ACED74|nr:RibD family protein [Xenococcus sp. PCC 7305]ELS04410.1 pyrimidine reductase, riboflavin biosynthesis [Xenococcus sp. PCC 7305]